LALPVYSLSGLHVSF